MKTQTTTPTATRSTGSFRCPRCGTTYPRVIVLRNWREWGVICLCEGGRGYAPTCPVTGDPPARAAEPREWDALDEWLAQSFPASDPLPGPAALG